MSNIGQHPSGSVLESLSDGDQSELSPNVGQYSTNNILIRELENSKSWAMVSRDWAISLELVDDGENTPDYGSKFYAAFAKQEADRAQEIADGIGGSNHQHSNFDILEATTASYTIEEKEKLEGIEDGGSSFDPSSDQTITGNWNWSNHLLIDDGYYLRVNDIDSNPIGGTVSIRDRYFFGQNDLRMTRPLNMAGNPINSGGIITGTEFYGSGDSLTYDNTNSSVEATTFKGAIDYLDQEVVTINDSAGFLNQGNTWFGPNEFGILPTTDGINLATEEYVDTKRNATSGKWLWDDTTSGAVASGYIASNSVQFSTTTEIRLSKTTILGDSIEGILGIEIGDRFVLISVDKSDAGIFTITSDIIDSGTYYTVPCINDNAIGGNPVTDNVIDVIWQNTGEYAHTHSSAVISYNDPTDPNIKNVKSKLDELDLFQDKTITTDGGTWAGVHTWTDTHYFQGTPRFSNNDIRIKGTSPRVTWDEEDGDGEFWTALVDANNLTFRKNNVTKFRITTNVVETLDEAVLKDRGHNVINEGGGTWGGNHTWSGTNNFTGSIQENGTALSSKYEPVFSKNTAFNKNFGTGSNTVCQGNDSRLSNARTPTAHTHSAADITSGTLAVARGGTGTTSSTGSGSNVLSSSPALSGNPTAPTQGAGNNSTRLATTAFVLANSASTTHNHDSQYLGISSKAADSELLDGLDGSQFVKTQSSSIITASFVRFNDNSQLRFGSGNDCYFWCNGSHQYLDLYSGIGNFYIRDGTTTRFTFDDAGHFTATGNVTAYSDEKIKENLEPIENALEKVCQLTGYTFDRTDIDTSRQAGLIAQEVEEVLPEVVSNIDGNKALAYGNTIALLVQAIKEQQEQIEELKKPWWIKIKEYFS